jgi:hypothetical protein
MISRTVFTITLGIFWFLYPPKAYAECSKCKAKVEWLRAQREKENTNGEVKGWDTNKTTWNSKTSSDQPIKVKTRVSEVNDYTIKKYAAAKKEKEEAAKKADKEAADKAASNKKASQ